MHPAVSQLQHSFPATRWAAHRVVVAVSGGADSTAMLCALGELADAAALDRKQLIVAHYHHGLRDDADRDQAFVQQLAQQLKIQCVTEQAPPQVWQQTSGEGIESLARRLRYDFLKRTAHEHHARYLVTAHTADDQAETLLFRMLRGTGLRGLAGIAPVQRLDHALSLVRPWLDTRRMTLEDYLRERNQPYCEDASNQSSHFTRNRLRHEVIPLLQSIMGRDVIPQTAGLASRLRELLQWLEPQLDQWGQDWVQSRGEDRMEWNLILLQEAPAFLRTELIRRAWRQQGWSEQAMTQNHWLRLAAITLDSAPQEFPGGIRAEVVGDTLCLTRSLTSSDGETEMWA